MSDAPGHRGIRRWSSIVLAVVTALALAGALLGAWVQTTVFNAEGMARRSVHTLDSDAVRHELALQLTDQLIKSGNRQVIAFRPAAQLTVETVIETDAFKSLFASSVRRLHASLLTGKADGGLDLSQTLGLLASGLQLNSEKAAVAKGASSDGTMSETIAKVADLPVWGWRDALAFAAIGLLVLAIVSSIASVWVAANRRLGVVRVGLAAVTAGVLILVLLMIGQRVATGFASDSSLRRAIGDAVWEATDDLRATAFAVALMGAVIAAAAAPSERFSPDHVRASLSRLFERMRSSTWGTIVLALVIGIAGLVVISNPQGTVSVVVFLGGLILVFLATRLLVSVASTVTATVDGVPASPSRRWLGWGIAVGGVAVAAGAFSFISIHSAKARAENSYVRECMGRADYCDLRLDQVTLPGAHNAMSAPQYPGWLFAEQIETIGGQLNSGVRALLIDAHYGKKSSVRVPGSAVNLVVTDIAGEFAVPGAEVPDPALKERAQQLAASASGVGTRGVYLCHNYCELGAVKMVDEMGAVRRFLDANPGEIVQIIVQDAVSSADIAKVFTDAGLLDQVVTLTPGEPLPRLGTLVDLNTRLIVFAERGDEDSPAWYPHAYDWFQETTYTFSSISGFTCEPNRGSSDNPLFLINHWVGRSPPDPDLAKKANAASVLNARVRQCLDQRGIVPNVIAADFATTGDLVQVADDLTGQAQG